MKSWPSVLAYLRQYCKTLVLSALIGSFKGTTQIADPEEEDDTQRQGTILHSSFDEGPETIAHTLLIAFGSVAFIGRRVFIHYHSNHFEEACNLRMGFKLLLLGLTLISGIISLPLAIVRVSIKLALALPRILILKALQACYPFQQSNDAHKEALCKEGTDVIDSPSRIVRYNQTLRESKKLTYLIISYCNIVYIIIYHLMFSTLIGTIIYALINSNILPKTVPSTPIPTMYCALGIIGVVFVATLAFNLYQYFKMKKSLRVSVSNVLAKDFGDMFTEINDSLKVAIGDENHQIADERSKLYICKMTGGYMLAYREHGFSIDDKNGIEALKRRGQQIFDAQELSIKWISGVAFTNYSESENDTLLGGLQIIDGTDFTTDILFLLQSAIHSIPAFLTRTLSITNISSPQEDQGSMASLRCAL